MIGVLGSEQIAGVLIERSLFYKPKVVCRRECNACPNTTIMVTRMTDANQEKSREKEKEMVRELVINVIVN
jgi:hypothetical protein